MNIYKGIRITCERVTKMLVHKKAQSGGHGMGYGCWAGQASEASHASEASDEPRSGEPSAANCTEHKLKNCT